MHKTNQKIVTVRIFGGKPETRRLCICNTLIFTGPDLGRIYNWCNCK